MKNYIYVMPGGGIFSRFFQFGIVPLADIDFDNVFLTLSPFEEGEQTDPILQDQLRHVQHHRKTMESYGIERPYDHIMGYVLDQYTDSTYVYGGYLPLSKLYDRNNPIEFSSRLQDYKRVLSKIHIKNNIKNFVHRWCAENKIGLKTLGVHLRITTMLLHENLKKVNFDLYCQTIDSRLETGEYNNIFVASDNEESLEKLINRYGSYIKCYPNMIRLKTELVTERPDFSWEYDMFYRKQFWIESFIECMTLAECGDLVCRDSNLSNMAVVFSNSIRRVYRP
jgi:hypothetical protein